MGRRHQLVQYAASIGGVVGITLPAQPGKLPFQRAHGFQSRSHLREMPVDQPVDVAAIPLRPVEKFDQMTHLGERNVERPAMADEG